MPKKMTYTVDLSIYIKKETKKSLDLSNKNI